jgi:hypothetical protein
MNDDRTEIPVLLALREELVDGVRRSGERAFPATRARARTRRVAVVGAAGLAVAAVFLVLALGPIGTSSGPRPAAAFSLEVADDGRVHVTMHQDFDDADRLADELRDEGVDVRVLPHPAHPMLQGTVEFPSHQLDDDGAVGVEEGDREFWIDPRRFDGEIEMLVYVAPEPGEDWQQAPSAFHPDEPLGGLPCILDGRPMTTEELQARARSVGIDRFTWVAFDVPDETGGSTGLPVPIGESDPAPPGEVSHAQRVGPDRLWVSINPPDVVAQLGPTPTPGMNLNVGESPEPECTPELRARWD